MSFDTVNKFEVGDKTLLRYRDLNYKIWHAISEFVDNSLHAFLHLDGSYKPEKCEVSIDFVDNQLSIFDNSGGIHTDDFSSVLSVGKSKTKSEIGKQLSEFGMGLKTAGIWLADEIIIETKHFDNTKAYSIHIDIEKLRVGQTEEYVNISECIPSSSFGGYTRITLSKLNRRITKPNIRKYKDALSSIYNRFISNGILILRWDDPIEPKLLKLATNFADGGDELKWPIDTKVTTNNGVKRIKGWIGILDKGKGSIGGFYIYRNGRQIHGYPENMYRPSEYYGETQTTSSFKLQNMVGEFDLDDWAVNHTKDAMNWGFDEEVFIESIKDTWNMAEGKLGEVLKTRKEQRGLVNFSEDHILKNAVENVARLVHKVESDPAVSLLNNFETGNLHKFSYETLLENLNKEEWRNENAVLKLKFFASRIEKEVQVYYIRCSDDNIPHSTTKVDRIDNKDVLSIFINYNHTYVDYLLQNTNNENREVIWSTFLWSTIIDAITDEMMTNQNFIEITKKQKEILHGMNFAWYVKNISLLNQT